MSKLERSGVLRACPLGNLGDHDGAKFRGRGLVYLTERTNYANIRTAIGLGSQLVENPELANKPIIAGKILASFLKTREIPIENAARNNDLVTVRRLINGATDGLDRFISAFQIGSGLLG